MPLSWVTRQSWVTGKHATQYALHCWIICQCLQNLSTWSPTCQQMCSFGTGSPAHLCQNILAPKLLVWVTACTQGAVPARLDSIDLTEHACTLLTQHLLDLIIRPHIERPLRLFVGLCVKGVGILCMCRQPKKCRVSKVNIITTRSSHVTLCPT
jgi:hypothetical protein